MDCFISRPRILFSTRARQRTCCSSTRRYVFPPPVLQGLLEHYRRVVFATTIHGYEGTGRGFALRFRDVLDRRTPGWRELRLETPIRWAPNDPLERFVFRALLLDAEPSHPARRAGDRAPSPRIELLHRDRLAADEATLSELFGLLAIAHYQSRPWTCGTYWKARPCAPGAPPAPAMWPGPP
jgi:hypothetical protein